VPLVAGGPGTGIPSRRRRLAVAAVLAALVIAVVITVLVVRSPGAPAPTAEAAATLPTVPVTTGDMVAATNARATLHYAQERPLVAARGGVLTAVPAPGTVVAPGGVLYRVDNLPVVLLRGSLPAWRAFEAGMTPGEDVRQLEQNLGALGVFRGDADATFTKATATAVSAWQKALGVERTGRLDRTAILFSDHDLRVAQPGAPLGADVAAGTELYRATATSKVVDLDLRLGDQQLAVVGAQVGITLPDGTATTGSVAAVGEPVERTPADGATDATAGTFVVPVTVALTDQAAVGAFPRASVTVQFASTLAAGVLTVPVEALVALDATSFAVETTGGGAGSVRRIPVTVGAFASGRVQVSGEGIREGLPVVVPGS
jgi:peptidoglycan hydrolase-like protein with peptidoglycan-binding domain